MTRIAQRIKLTLFMFAFTLLTLALLWAQGVPSATQPDPPSFAQFDRDHDNAPAFTALCTNPNGPISFPAGFYFTKTPIYLAGNIRGAGASYGLPTNRYRPGNIGGPATVICYIGPKQHPAVICTRRGGTIDGVQFQYEEFRRDSNNNPILPVRNGSVGIAFGRTEAAPGGKWLFGNVSFVGWTVAIDIVDEANHIVFLLPVFEHCYQHVRSQHDQAFGIHLVHAHCSGVLDTSLNFDRGGRWHSDYYYTNCKGTVAHFGNLGPNRSSGSIDQLHVDTNAEGFKLLDAGTGWLKFRVGGHVAKGAIPAEDWINHGPGIQSNVNYDNLWFGAQPRPQ